MPTQANYNHIKEELLQARQHIEKLEKEILSYKDLKKVSFHLKDVSYNIEELSPEQVPIETEKI